MKSVIVSFLLSMLSGELKRGNISKTISTFFFNKKDIGISLPLAVRAFEGSRPFSRRSSKFLMFSLFFASLVNAVNKCFENQNKHSCMMHLVFDRYFILSSLSYSAQAQVRKLQSQHVYVQALISISVYTIRSLISVFTWFIDNGSQRVLGNTRHKVWRIFLISRK